MHRVAVGLALTLSILVLVSFGTFLPAQKKPRPKGIPHNQDTLPGPALTPAEAIKKMKVPEGFSVELVASEPQLVNPVGMTFDEKGRIWVVESLEYPRRSAGVGKDRIKCLELGQDGKVAKVTIFAEGLNIPSGIAVGHGGVWVANSPDILFYKIGPDGKVAGKPEVIVTGFGRTDTHELPNSFTWGPDGWLYGWNGVFNYSHVKYRGKEYKFTCAIFRIHPRTREFELFCEGTSNPWGLAINENGDFFASACVIDHLWHLTETGYYIRQGGPYPPHTWPARSIVHHKHQKAAYCGLVWFDSDAYPKEYREKLFMGNIHGGCVNSDELIRDGATYFGKTRPDLLTANDQWFMPVSQKVGPDGCLYILDWYDRYHCYQDANRDPKGIDRLNGRLYRIRYKDTPHAEKFDLAKETDDQLIERLKSPNVYYREVAQRILSERATPEIKSKLQALILDEKTPRKPRIHAMFALISSGKLPIDFHTKLLADKDATFRAWGVRAAGNQGKADATVLKRLTEMITAEKSPDVLVQLAVANTKLDLGGVPTLLTLLSHAPEDKLLPHIVWQNLHPMLETQSKAFVDAVKAAGRTDHLREVLPRAIDRILASRKPDPAGLVGLIEFVRTGKSPNPAVARMVLNTLTTKIQNGEIADDQLTVMRKQLQPLLTKDLSAKNVEDRLDAVVLLTAFKDDKGIEAAKNVLTTGTERETDRLRALEALAAIRDGEVLKSASNLLTADKGLSNLGKAQLLAALGRLDDPQVAVIVLERYGKLHPEIKPRAVELLTQRANWGKALFRAVAEKKFDASVINVNQARRLLASKDAELTKLVTKHYGVVREGRNPDREKVVSSMRRLLQSTKGDPQRGVAVYKKLCAQCHKIHGDGVEVGPDITSNGRASFEQLLSNVFDPSLVIGPGYQAVLIETTKGRALTGLLVEDSPTRVVLKVQGGKQEVVARKDIERMGTSKLSLMPEDVEKQLKPQEIADLFSFLVLDKPPSDPKARRIQGTPNGL